MRHAPHGREPVNEALQEIFGRTAERSRHQSGFAETASFVRPLALAASAAAWIPISPCNLPVAAIAQPSAKAARVRRSPLPSRPIAESLRQRVGIDPQCEALHDFESVWPRICAGAGKRRAVQGHWRDRVSEAQKPAGLIRQRRSGGAVPKNTRYLLLLARLPA